MTRPAVGAALLQFIFFCSGVAGLGYQIAWSKMFAAGLGHEMPAVLAVVAAFMGGMALGAGALDHTLSRSRRPGCWCAALEAFIGVWALLSNALIPLLNRSAPPLIGLEPTALRHWIVAFGLPFLALSPAAAAMGATLPAMERFLSSLVADGRCVAALYAANTFGAMTGALVSAFVLLPTLGLRETVWALAAINGLCSVAVWALATGPEASRGPPAVQTATRVATSLDSERGQRCPERPAASEARDKAVRTPSPLWVSRVRVANTGEQLVAPHRVFFFVFLSGLLGMGYETVGVRVLSQVLENTVYTLAAVLAVFLLGSALGAALFQRFARCRTLQPLFGDLLCGLAASGLLGIAALWRAPSVYDACRTACGDTPLAVLGAEMGVAATVFGLPTVFMGAIFSQLAQSARREEGGVGQALAWNTLGGAVAPALFGVLLLPALGSKWTMVSISLGYLTMLAVDIGFGVPALAGARRQHGLRGELPAVRVQSRSAGEKLAACAAGTKVITGWRRAFVLVPIAVIVFLPGNLHLVQLPFDGQLMAYREGVMGSIAVVRDATGNLSLRVDNHFQMGGTGATEAERRHAHLPLLLHPAPKRALFLGLGTGITFGAAGTYPGLRADGVELLPEVIAVMPWFEPNNNSPGRQPQLKLYAADARRFVRGTGAKYDVIVADLFHPARDGAGSLYTVEHFRSIRERLAPGGLFCQWLPLHQLDEAMLRVITRTFLEVFPDAAAYLLRFNVDAPVLGLVGDLEPRRYSARWVERRLGAPALGAQLRELGLADSIRLFGCLVAGPKDLRQFAGEAPLNTDDQPRVAFGAPRFIYQRNTAPYARLFALLRGRKQELREILDLDPGPASEEFLKDVAGFIAARDVYLRGLVADAEGRSSEAIDAYVESTRLSPDFTLGYAQCLSLAAVEAKSNPKAARALLERLVSAQPSRPVAEELLRRLREP